MGILHPDMAGPLHTAMPEYVWYEDTLLSDWIRFFEQVVGIARHPMIKLQLISLLHLA
jgi:hypothetical protein